MANADHLRVVDSSSDPPPPPDPLVGQIIDGRYLVERVLGEGGMGLVYKVKHTALNKDLAIKVLRPDVSRDKEIITRFKQEAQSASAIGNEHIIDIIDFGVLPTGATYFVMEFLNGIDLTGAIERQRPMEARRVIHVGKQLCQALGAAHEREIVHRDLKPDNIYLVKRGNDSDFVKVLDFGIAKVSKQTTKLTRVGQVFGTPHYMSPEQCAGTGVDHRTDIYALGVILYEMTAGKVPFDADNLMGILTKHMYEAPIPPHTLPPPVDVPPGLEAIILKCLTKSQDQRYQTMAEVYAELDLLEKGQVPAAVMEGVDRRAGGTTSGSLDRPSLQVEVGGDVEIPGYNKGKGKLVAVLLALLVIGGGATAYFVLGQGEEPAPAIAAEKPVTPTPLATPTPAPTAAPAPATPVGVDPPPVAAASQRMIPVTSEPIGAAIYQDNILVGRTPLEIPALAEGKNLKLEARLDGYNNQEMTLAHFSQMAEFRLERRGQRPSGRASRPATPAPAPGPAPAAPAPTPRQPARQTAGEVLDPWAN